MKTASPSAIRIASAVLLSSALFGCANLDERQNATLKGAAVGAAAGAVLSSATGGRAGTGALVGGAVGAVASNLWSRRMEQKRASMQAATAGTGVTVARTSDNRLQVNLPSDISFDVNSAVVKPQLQPVLDTFASGLDAATMVRVVGHTDSTGGEAINTPLSWQRAQSVRDYLVSRGVPANRVTIDGRGSSEPIADNGTADGRARNRRVELFLSEPAQN